MQSPERLSSLLVSHGGSSTQAQASGAHMPCAQPPQGDRGSHFGLSSNLTWAFKDEHVDTRMPSGSFRNLGNLYIWTQAASQLPGGWGLTICFLIAEQPSRSLFRCPDVGSVWQTGRIFLALIQMFPLGFHVDTAGPCLPPDVQFPG